MFAPGKPAQRERNPGQGPEFVPCSHPPTRLPRIPHEPLGMRDRSTGEQASIESTPRVDPEKFIPPPCLLWHITSTAHIILVVPLFSSGSCLPPLCAYPVRRRCGCPCRRGSGTPRCAPCQDGSRSQGPEGGGRGGNTVKSSDQRREGEASDVANIAFLINQQPHFHHRHRHSHHHRHQQA
jgi:hypothetical protein